MDISNQKRMNFNIIILKKIDFLISYMSLTLEEVSQVFKEELNNPDILAVSTWVPRQLGELKPFNYGEYLEKALRNADYLLGNIKEIL